MTTANLTLADNDTVIQYTAVGGETAFEFDFPILAEAELAVSVDQVDQVLGTDYTVSGVGDEAGGTVTFTSAVAAGEVITLWLDMPIKRLTGFSTGAAVLTGQALNTEFARQVRHDQMLLRDIRRSLRLAPDDPQSGQDMELPTQTSRAGKFLAFDASGVPTVADVTGSEDTSLRADLASTDSDKGTSLVAVPKTDEETNALVSIVDAAAPVLNVLRYGADPSGTNDSADAIQAAIDVAEAYATSGNGGGAVVYLPAGNYRLLTGLTITGQFVGMRGDGKFNSNLFPEGGIIALTVQDRALYSDFGIVGESKTDGNTGIFVTGAKATFRDIRVRRLEDGVVMEDAFMTRWHGGEFEGCGNAVVMVGTSDLGWGAGSFRCQDHKFYGGSFANNDASIRLQGARNVIFYGPNIEANEYGLILEGEHVIGCRVLDPWCENTHIQCHVNITVSTGVSLNCEWSGGYNSLNNSAANVPAGGALDEARFLLVEATAGGFRNFKMRENFVAVGRGGTTVVAIEVDGAAALQNARAENNFWASSLTYSGAAASRPLGIENDSLFAKVIRHTETIDVGSINAGAHHEESVTVTGAAVGDFVRVFGSGNMSDVRLTGFVSATDTVRLLFTNNGGAPNDLPSMNYRILVEGASALGFG